MYSERVIPILSLIQRNKSFEFFRKGVKNWGGGRGIIYGLNLMVNGSGGC